MLSLLRKLGGDNRDKMARTGHATNISPTASKLFTEIKAQGQDPANWIRERMQRQQLYGPAKGSNTSNLDRIFSNQVSSTIKEADKLLTHKFDLLGSGPYQPIAPGCSAWSDGYQPIDWALDPISGLRFPMNVSHKEWDLYSMRPGMADVKLPWELARCQHWVTLAQAFRLTKDTRYATEIANQLYDFMEANPVGYGVNWTCTMDVAIRALNWALALEWIAAANFGKQVFWHQANAALFDHACFIFDNLEDKYEVTSNHFLSNVVGLYYLATWFSGLPSGKTWNEFCRDALEREIATQVLEDGADFESSIPYHRLVTELFLGAARLADFTAAPLSKAYQRQLTSMVTYLLGIMRPDGLMPQVGDADDGRLHIFTGYRTWVRQDSRHLLAPAAALLRHTDWSRYCDESGTWEAYWWGYAPENVSCQALAPPQAQKLYDHAGHAIFREDELYLLVTNSIVGTKGFGNHKHNDQLSFEYHADGTPLFVDPGSHVYTSDPISRNLFRATKYHNTLEIDGTEQNETNPEWLFRIMESKPPEHKAFYKCQGQVNYCGSHFGYERLEYPVVHERAFRLFPEDRALLISDTVFGNGRHTLRWHFHAAPGVHVLVNRTPGVGIAFLKAAGKTYALASLEQIPVLSGKGNYSSGYGVKTECPMFDFQLRASLNGRCTWTFVIAPVQWLAKDLAIEAITSFSERTK